MKALRNLRTERELTQWAVQHGASIEQGANHILVVTDKGKCAIPRHKGDLCKGTLHSIIKTFIALGLACIVIAIWAAALGVI